MPQYWRPAECWKMSLQCCVVEFFVTRDVCQIIQVSLAYPLFFACPHMVEDAVEKLGFKLLCWSYSQYMWTWSLYWFLFHVCDLPWTTDNVWGPGSSMLQVVFEWICEEGCNHLCILLHRFIKQGRVSLAYPPFFTCRHTVEDIVD